MGLLEILTVLGGIGLFLYGMSLMGSSLEKVAGAGLERTLEKLTNNKLKGVVLGAVVTAVIQSSSATAVMTIGFVNAGIMTLAQAIPVVMGANIGTTITGQILRLSDVSGENLVMTLLKPSSFAPVCIAVGAAITLISKKRKTKDIASILIGFGILFVGITTMEGALNPLKESQAFQNLFSSFENPFLGVLVGTLVTAILQSSSASVGVLQAVSSTGAVTFAMAAPIIMGQNIGKCVTVILASIGTNKKAKRAVAVNVIVNVAGTVLFLVGIYGFQYLVGFSFWQSTADKAMIANFHSLFNIITAVVFLPFTNLLAKLSSYLVKDNQPSKIDQELALLDERFLKTPSLALEQCKKVILSMGDAVKENFGIASSLMENYNEKQLELLQENEKFLDRTESVLTDYLVKITGKGIDDESSQIATENIHTIGDMERIGDYCKNVAEVAEHNSGAGIRFSEEGQTEYSYLKSAVKEIIDLTVESYQLENESLAFQVEPLEETIDLLVETLKSKHIERLQSGQCSTQSGISYVEMLNNMERISDHCSNIAVHIIQRKSHNEAFDVHVHLKQMHAGNSEQYAAFYNHYRSLYCDPVRQLHKGQAVPPLPDDTAALT